MVLPDGRDMERIESIGSFRLSVLFSFLFEKIGVE